MEYFAGGFNGGTKEQYLKMAQKLATNIRLDYDKNIIAVWHDESHINRYFIDNPPTKILDPGYCYGESLKPPFAPRLIALDKNHNEVRT
jgi:histo-blood group ABO system transferase